MTSRFINLDCRKAMAYLKPASVDAIVTDPPYGLEFMGKGWDHGVPGVDFWIEALRVLKPGGHLLAFGGTRTFHRLTVAIEDTGFEIRDCMMWLYGSGFPKSLNVSKAIDKATGATLDAEQWQGWGTALKPAWEPIIVARKPLVGTVAGNVLAHGTGAINVDGCRIPGIDPANAKRLGKDYTNIETNFSDHVGQITKAKVGGSLDGRWPANVILDDEAGAMLDRQAGERGGSGKASGPSLTGASTSVAQGRFNGVADTPFYGDSGGASRFFYCAKASKAERNAGCEMLPDTATKKQNIHPTVKPVALMRYLVRLVTPPGGTLLDPFMGSGSTGIACVHEGFDFIGIDSDRENGYFDIAKARVAHAEAAA